MKSGLGRNQKIIGKAPASHDNQLDIYFHFPTATSRQITNFLRGYVDNEINLNSDGSCWGTCSDYKFARNYQCSSGTFCEYRNVGEVNPTCRGTIIDCMYIDKRMEVCPSVSVTLLVALKNVKKYYNFFKC